MTLFIDARIPVAPGDGQPPGPTTALLIEGGAPAPGPQPVARFTLPEGGHPAGCACCAPRGPVAEALGRLFLARARGECPWFNEVVALANSEAGRQAIRQALQDDPLVSARFRAASAKQTVSPSE
jgi:hypothetical protein